VLVVQVSVRECRCVGGTGNRERVLALVFDCIRQRRVALHSMLLAVASTWPQVLSKSGPFSNMLSNLIILSYQA